MTNRMRESESAGKIWFEGMVDGLCASAALWPLTACRTAKASEIAEFLFHASSMGSFGNKFDMKHALDTLTKLDEQAYKAIGAKVKGGADKVRELADADNGIGTWMTADEMVEIGLVNEVLDIAGGADPKTGDGGDPPVPEPEAKARGEDHRELRPEPEAKTPEPEPDDDEGRRLADEWELERLRL